MTDVPQAVSDYMAKIGAKGGAATRGEKKNRGKAHYEKMQRARARKKARK